MKNYTLSQWRTLRNKGILQSSDIEALNLPDYFTGRHVRFSGKETLVEGRDFRIEPTLEELVALANQLQKGIQEKKTRGSEPPSHSQSISIDNFTQLTISTRAERGASLQLTLTTFQDAHPKWKNVIGCWSRVTNGTKDVAVKIRLLFEACSSNPHTRRSYT